MQKVRLFADCFKTLSNCRIWINPNFKLDFLPKVVTFLFKTTGFSIGLICPVVLKKEMQKVFQETFRSQNYNTLPLHHEGYAINKKIVIFKHSLKNSIS